MRKFTDPFPEWPTRAFWNFVLELSPIFYLAGIGSDALDRPPDNDSVDGEKYLAGSKWNFEAMLLSRAVDLFQTYLYSLLDVIFSQRPEMLPDKKISVREVFKATHLDELKAAAIGSIVNEYSYKNIIDLHDLLEKNFGFSLFERNITKVRVNRLIQKRNIIAHNNGTVNNRFIDQVGCKLDQVGMRVKIGQAYFRFRYLSSLAASIDKRASEKFSLDRMSATDIAPEATF